MSTKFDGFSQDEINKINTKPKKGGLFAAKSLGVGRGIRRVPDKPIVTSTQPNDSNMINHTNLNKVGNAPNIKKNTNAKTLKNNSSQLEECNRKISDESLTKLQEAVHFQPLSVKIQKQLESNEKKINKTEQIYDGNDESIINLSSNENQNSDDNSNYTCPKMKTETLEIKEQLQQMSPFRGISLKDFESQRKIREEQNKIKKEMLYKAIEKHTQKTTAEVKKIEEIKNDLAKLDQDLAADVAILRKQIENACIHYSNIEKHYNKVEQMFLKAKLDLHNASEKKELLTEHLCTVITHNEDRKAKKLSELMEKVGLSPTTGEYHLIANEISHGLENNNELIDK